MERAFAFFLVASLASGCFVFDSSLYMIDGGTDAGAFALAETCSNRAPLLALPEGVRMTTFPIDTQGRTDNERDVLGCTGSMESGPDAFLRIEAARGEHWHFHVRVDQAQGGADPAMYALFNCDVRECAAGDGLDVCGSGSDEHFTFVPEAAGGTYEIAFDSRDAMGFAGSVEVYRTTCMDGMQDHGESCDDGNDVETDGCDSLCRSTLSASGALEDEVNDDIFMANALMITPGTSMSVRGEISRLCEVDVFAIEVPAGASIEARLRAEGGAACPASAAPIALELLEPSGLNQARVRATGIVPGGEFCPAIAATETQARALPAGTYHLRVTKVQERPDPFNYQLEVTLVAP